MKRNDSVAGVSPVYGGMDDQDEGEGEWKDEGDETRMGMGWDGGW